MGEVMSSRKQLYQIRLEGHVDLDWSDWFEESHVEYTPDGETHLSGRLPDQSALHGVLMKIRDLGLTLIEVVRVDPSTNATDQE
jgi:hypothetical protein